MLHRRPTVRCRDQHSRPRPARARHGGRGPHRRPLPARLRLRRRQKAARRRRLLSPGVRDRHAFPRREQTPQADGQGRLQVRTDATEKRASMSGVQRGVSLQAIQFPVRAKLDDVSRAMATIVASEMPLVGQVSAHLRAMRGKLFRPTLLLLSSQVEERDPGSGKGETAAEKAVTLAAALELIHLATLVHDDAVDHSALRRGMPTVNALFSHQISVIMGDFLYSTALTHLVGLGDLEALQALTRASTEMTLGEMRQLAVTEPLGFSEAEYYVLIRSKTASLMRTACELGALAGAPSHEKVLGDFGENLGMAFQITRELLDHRGVQETTGKPS